MIYENICKLAKERGISINKLEEKANVSTGSICKWGNSVSPTVKNIKKVADILKCTVDELISATDETGSKEGREKMKSEDERKWFDFHGIQPELAELYRYFDRTVLCYRIIIAVLLGIIAILLLK